jgi:hypothetical protein
MIDNATLQLIIKQLNKLCAGQEKVKNNGRARQEKIEKTDKHISDFQG